MRAETQCPACGKECVFHSHLLYHLCQEHFAQHAWLFCWCEQFGNPKVNHFGTRSSNGVIHEFDYERLRIHFKAMGGVQAHYLECMLLGTH